MTPTQIFIGGVILTVLTVAQRILNTQNRTLGRALVIASGALFVLWCFLVFPFWVGLAVAFVIWSIALWFLFRWTSTPQEALPEADPPPEAFEPAKHPNEEFPVIRKLAIYDRTPGREHPSKVYVELINNTSDCAKIGVSRWRDGIRARLAQNVLQVWLGNEWCPPGHGLAVIWVGPGQPFRLWIAPDAEYSTEGLQRLCDERRLGTLAIRVNDQERDCIL